MFNASNQEVSHIFSASSVQISIVSSHHNKAVYLWNTNGIYSITCLMCHHVLFWETLLKFIFIIIMHFIIAVLYSMLCCDRTHIFNLSIDIFPANLAPTITNPKYQYSSVFDHLEGVWKYAINQYTTLLYLYTSHDQVLGKPVYMEI